jgi:O-antigen/teichoic acid export membrane protein
MAALPLWLFAEPVLRLMGGAPLATHAPLLRWLAALILIVPATAGLNFLLPADKLRTRIVCDTAGIVITAIIAAWAALHDRPIWVAAGAVFGYAAAIAMAHVALHDKLVEPTRALLTEFCGVGMRVLPGTMLAWLMPGPWWLRMCVFYVSGAALLFLTCPALVERMRDWSASMDP